MKENHIKANSTKIEDFKFAKNKELEEVVLEEGMTHIGERAFAECTNLKRITLPSTLEYIGPAAFLGCENLEEIVLPPNIKKIPYRCFTDCKRLKRIIIPEGVKEIEWGAFTGCNSLEEITIPNTVEKLNEQIFLNCKSLKTVHLPDIYTSLPDELFRNCPKLDIKLSPKIKKLGSKVFERCYKQSTFPENVKEFGEDCFKNCRSIDNITINKEVTSLPDGLFDGCINLNTITFEGNKIPIGKRTFRNCRSLKEIPKFVGNYNEGSFENCTSLTNIDLISPSIPTACFRGCTNLSRINNIKYLRNLSPYALSGCGFEEIDLSNIENINNEILSNCKRLRKVKFNPMTRTIGERAFYNCSQLASIDFPVALEKVKKEAFMRCNSVKELNIPPYLKAIGDKAFSYMDNLERINADHNNTFTTPDHKILINQDQQSLVLYASGIKDRFYSIEDYVIDNEMFVGQTVIKPISYISPYAFAGAKNLEELTLCACAKEIEKTAFEGCSKLKKLNIMSGDFFTCPGFNLRDHGRYYVEDKPANEAAMPFEHVEFQGDVVNIFPRALQGFKRVKKITLPKEHGYVISSTALNDCTELKEIEIPNQVTRIEEKALPTTTKLIFENGFETKKLESFVENDNYFGNYRLYVLSNGTYRIEQGDTVTLLTKKQIEESCTNPEFIEDNPILFLDFMNCLKEHNIAYSELMDGILMKYMSTENRKILYESLKPNDELFLKVLRESKLTEKDDEDTKEILKNSNFGAVVKYVETFRERNIDSPLLFNKKLFAKLNPDIFRILVELDQDLLTKVIEESKLLECNDKEENRITDSILKDNRLAKFVSLIKKYNIKDKYLFNKAFIACANNPLFEELLKVYDANTKRLLKSSQVLNNATTSIQNVNDLLILMKILGALEDDDITRQKAATFITEKILSDKLPTGEDNNHKIVGDDIHRVFNFPGDIEYNEEFAEFFLNNYHDLIRDERIKSGFIQRIYLNFKEISRTSTSNKGYQRKLKVTLEKCRNFLSSTKFDGVNQKNKDLAYLIGAWYDRNETWEQAQRIYKESLTAPRNIFTKVTLDQETGELIYDNDPKKDLKEERVGFTYEWLPKQSYDNLILGKYCSCCAHVEGAGQGIMRASMISPDCQNLVVRNNFGEIIAKATLYVNRKAGYAVFNNVESSLNYKTEDNLKKIYDALVRGANAFLEEYNKNNPERPIEEITIGGARNTILNQMTIEKHPVVTVHQAINFGEYSLRPWSYNGDWASTQRLLIKKKTGKENG